MFRATTARPIALAAMLAGGGLLVLPGSLCASEKGRATYLQMAGMTATVVTSDKRRTSVPITAFLEVRGTEAANLICRRYPVVRNAVLEATAQQPAAYTGGQIEIGSVSDFIAKRINTSLGEEVVVRIAFVYGTPKETAASATDLAEAGDVISRERTVKSGERAQTAPCRRITQPPESVKWAGVRKQLSGDHKPAPPLRDNQPPPRPAATTFESHPQFAPREPGGGMIARPAAPQSPESDKVQIAGALRPTEAVAPPSAGDCVSIDSLWKYAQFPYSGAMHTLSNIFTIDSDRDGLPDNVGFVLNAEGHPRTILRYFDQQGQAAPDIFPALALKDPKVISRLCFGQHVPVPPSARQELRIDIMQPSAKSEPVKAASFRLWGFVLLGGIVAGIAILGLVLKRKLRGPKPMPTTASESDRRARRLAESKKVLKKYKEENAPWEKNK
ncbi:MAG: hypothetical protein FJX42_03870 [Alphaproteobacteria bacterium]|nr:hypothetical protein [Alphaproteobacteria bacterium]